MPDAKELFKYLRFALFKRKIVLRKGSAALGDNLIISFLAREIKKNYPYLFVVVETNWPELFKGNKNVDLVLNGKTAPFYHKVKYRIDENTTIHMLDQLIAGLPMEIGKWTRKVDVFLDDADYPEVQRQLSPKYIVICPEGKGKFSANRKEWGWENFQRLVDSLHEWSFIQIGLKKDKLLDGVKDFRGVDILTAAYILKKAVTAVVLEGGLMHLCNAVGTPAIVIYGGIVKPEVSSYDSNLAVVSTPPCSPCFTSERTLTPCLTMDCMKNISPELIRDLILEERYLAGGIVRV